MKVVFDWIRNMGIACWCHIYDITITGNNAGYLEHVTAKVLERLAHTVWKISIEKSVLRPVAKIEYLGVFVSREGISQTPKITEAKKKLLLDLLKPTCYYLTSKGRQWQVNM